MRDTLPNLHDIEQAEARIRKYIPPTPLEHSERLSTLYGREVYLKLEVFQPIRVFKIRGALNKLLSLGDSALRRGIITASSGNHGLAIAYSSRIFGIKAVICVPENVNPQKIGAIMEQGAEVIRAGANYDEVYENTVKMAARRKLTFVHAFDDKDVIAGQGTCGLEISRQSSEVDSAVVAIGGGGLISGVSIALKESIDDVRVYGAETKAIPSMYESLKVGKRVHIKPSYTIADGMQASVPGRLTFEAATKFVDKIGLVSDSEIKGAIYELLVNARVLAEPAGASPLAALKNPLRKERGKHTALVISGGNISLELLSEILNSEVKPASGGHQTGPVVNSR
jgi:threonine dehydratase